MNERTEILEATKRATQLTIDHGFKDRIQTNGYTRIDPFMLAEAVELAVLVRPLPRLLGAFLQEGDVPGILVNSDRPIGMVHLTCAHELGHYFLGHDPHLDKDIDYSDSPSLPERVANEFAYHLLMPRWLIANVMSRKRWDASSLTDPLVVYQLSLRLGVSFSAMVWSLKKYRLLTTSVANSLAKKRPIDIKSALIPKGTELLNKSDVWLLDPWDEASIIEPRSNDQFLLELPSQAGSGYIWSAQEARQAGFTIQPVLLDPENTPKPKLPVKVGAPLQMTYIAKPDETLLSNGQPVTWTLVERQPWNPASEPSSRIDMRTQFETLSDGLTPGARRRYLERVATQ